MYDNNVEPTTNNAIKLNLNGIKKISKERVLVELYKILDLKNFMKLNENENLKEIFNLIFPEFENLKRLSKLKKISNNLKINRSLLLATLLIDDKDSHEYFGHKYNISNNIKEKLNSFAINLKMIKENKNFFSKDLEKNIYFYDKDHLTNLNILNFVINDKVKTDDFFNTFKRILKSKIHKFTIDGKYLMKNGMQEGALMGKVLKKIEEEWIRNNFKITKAKIREIIHSYSN